MFMKKKKINWSTILRLTVIEAVIIVLVFGSWYYFMIKVPQEERIRKNIEQNIRITESMREVGYSGNLIEDLIDN
ncbi:MAG: hypothetical protein WD607_04230 [Candidatus Paceibacterota bacterium]